ncbi:MAG: hypothetical protein ONB55_22555 [candidate division KSB1 bacterium]|nr:hypothetical protein [candidate division KSB1 bacterium]
MNQQIELFQPNYDAIAASMVDDFLKKCDEAGLDQGGKRLLLLHFKLREILEFLESFEPSERKQFAIRLMDEVLRD